MNRSPLQPEAVPYSVFEITPVRKVKQLCIIYKKYNKSAIDLYVHSLENLEYSEISYDVLLMDLSKMSLVMFTK